MTPSRRHFLGLAGLVPLGLVAIRSAQAQGATCYDPATLPFEVKGQRETLGFVETSTDPKRRCGLCAFFTAGSGTCGTCQLMTGAPVTALGVCSSFAAKS